MSGLGEHRPTTSVGDGRERCEADGYLWPCPDVRLAPRPLSGDERDLHRLLVDDVDVGWHVYARQPSAAETFPPGGMVLSKFCDRDGVLTFRVLDWPHGRPFLLDLPAVDIDPALADGPNARSIRGQARRLCLHVGRRRGLATGDELQLVTAALALYVALEGGHAR